MAGKSTKKVLMIILCFAISILGLYMQFFYKGDEKNLNEDEIETEQKIRQKENADGSEKIIYDYDYSNLELPTEENESSYEMYTEGETINVYFTNTALLDQCSMPLAAQAELIQDVQRFLYLNGYDDITELVIDNEEFIDDEEKVMLICSMSGYEEKLQITFSKNENKLLFAIIYIDTE